MKIDRISSLVSVVSLVVAGMSAFVYFNQPSQHQPPHLSSEQITSFIYKHQDTLTKAPNDPVLGNPKGNVTLVEFFDYRCSYCKAIHPSLLQVLEDDGHIRYVAKEFPILGAVSKLASQAALASQKQGLYGKYNNALMSAKHLTGTSIFTIAEHIGIDVARLKNDMVTYQDEIKATLAANFKLAKALELKGTPAFIAGTILVPGMPNVAGLKKLIIRARLQNHQFD